MVEHTQHQDNITIHSTKRFRWTTADIAVAAALGIAAGIIFWGFNFAYSSISPVLGGLLPGFASILHGVWYFSGTLAVLILRKPGSAIFVNLVGCAAEMVLGNSFSFGFIFFSAALRCTESSARMSSDRMTERHLPTPSRTVSTMSL